MAQNKQKQGLQNPKAQLPTAGTGQEHNREFKPIKPEFSAMNRKQQRKNAKLQKKQLHMEYNQMRHMNNLNKGQPKPAVVQEQIDEHIDVDKVVEEKPKRGKFTVKQQKPKIDKRIVKLQKEIEEDDKEIQQLTSKLGLKQSKLSRTMIQQDGYDSDIFEFLDHIEEQTQKNKDEQLDQYLPYQHQQQNKQEFDDEDEDEDVENEDIEEEDEEDNNDDEILEEEDVEQDEEDYEAEEDEEIDEEEEQQEDEENINEQAEPVQIKVKAKVNSQQLDAQLKEEAAAAKVIREQHQLDIQNVLSSDQSLEIKKQLNRSLNKLSEANINIIAKDILQIFEDHPNQIVAQLFSQQLVQSTVKAQQLLQYLLSCMSTVSCYLHQIFDNITFAEIIKQVIQALQNSTEPYEVKNITLIFCHWYILESISIDFIKEFISYLCDRINSNNVENLISIVQYCGKKVRSDNPAILKDIIDEIKSKVEAQENDSKTQFLVLTLNDLRLNKKINDQGSRLEFLINWKKTQCQKLIPKVFPMGFQQSLNSEFKNVNWWKPIVTNEEQTQLYKEFASTKKQETLKKLEKLAIEQKMITETRRAIFIIVMSAEDLFEASENLIKLGYLKKKKQDVALVLVEMCANENSYNPYYSGLTENIVLLERGMKQQIQYALWDKFKLLESYSLRKQNNVAKYAAYLLKKQCISILVLKWFNFTELNSVAKQFLCILFSNFLTKIKLEIMAKQCKNLFENVDFLPLRTGIQSFLKTIYRDHIKQYYADNKQIQKDTQLMTKLLDEEDKDQ